MELSPRAAELTNLFESRIRNFYANFQVDEIGRVVSVGDGIAQVYGLNEIQAGEMVLFANGVKGMALNLENENVGIVVFGGDTAIKEGDLVKRTGSIVDVPAGKAMLGRVVDAMGVPIDGRGALSDHEQRRVECKPEIFKSWLPLILIIKRNETKRVVKRVGKKEANLQESYFLYVNGRRLRGRQVGRLRRIECNGGPNA
ncbi:unnamed protein product [Eruca vesicaria subsp. sativa]|uniref:ATPase F1/V1/A1 complex alpha/beta subunit N-terminal domain-containing protein n=1 Tax=Eruca vesicaria subsp. sativa TaxID=29727 RepID=A0ABC8J3J0_ERUVS|nr:unnamed protein product [Eruca vesicaria subsp. sativa]